MHVTDLQLAFKLKYCLIKPKKQFSYVVKLSVLLSQTIITFAYILIAFFALLVHFTILLRGQIIQHFFQVGVCLVFMLLFVLLFERQKPSLRLRQVNLGQSDIVLSNIFALINFSPSLEMNLNRVIEDIYIPASGGCILYKPNACIIRISNVL